MKRVLLDTNILIHREAATVVNEDIGRLLNWIDRLGYQKCLHPLSLGEIEKHRDPRVRATFRTKLTSYHEIRTIAPLAAELAAIAANDATENDRIDTQLLNELFLNRVDLLISEDGGITRKARTLGLAGRVFTIEAFLEKAVAENPGLVDYRVLAVKRVPFGAVDVSAPFFDSFRRDYGGPAFDRWFQRKCDEDAYVCYDGPELTAFLYLKREGPGELCADITPAFTPKLRLKIGTFKVVQNGLKLGERFLKIVFDNAVAQGAAEIYVTIFGTTFEQQRLIALLKQFGFRSHGVKTSGAGGKEDVLVRDMTPRFDADQPKLTFPFVSRSARAFIVPIRPEYHTSLLPDSILRTESPADFVEMEPHRNAISKVYVSGSVFRALRSGDVIIFYRTGGLYKSVVTSLGIVERVSDQFRDAAHFVEMCRRRSVFTDAELKTWWQRHGGRPFVTAFLYAYAFPKRPTMKDLIAARVIRDVDSAPRGFEPLSPESFQRIIELSRTDARIIVD